MNQPHLPEMYWDGYQPEQIVLGLTIGGQKVRKNTPQQRLLVAELQELLRLLFPQTQTLLVKSLPSGFSGTGVMRVQPFYPGQGGGCQVVVKCGERRTIAQEHAQYLRYVQHFLGGDHSTVVLNQQHTTQLGGILYSFLGGSIDPMQDFATFYRHASIAEIRQVLDHLFRQTCGLWYANHSALQPLDLTAMYQTQFHQTLNQLERLVARRLPSVLSQKTLTFRSLNQRSPTGFSNPMMVLRRTPPFVCSTYLCTTHGDLNPWNMMIDTRRGTWLIDFQSTGPGHILRDVAMLDTMVRFQLLLPHEATLEERFLMEEALCSIHSFHQLEQVPGRFSPANPALAKAFEVVLSLRMLARWIVEKNPQSELREYAVALLYHTLDTFTFFPFKVEQQEHALLSASLLVDYLSRGKEQKESGDGFTSW